MAFEIPSNGPLTWSAIIGGIPASLYVILKILRGDRVEGATDSATMKMIANLQAERDRAVARADASDAAREKAIDLVNGLQLQIVQLQNQVQQLSKEVAAINGGSAAIAVPA
jgi:hypothetical protein